MPKAERRPDGVALEPPPVLPPTSERADARGIVALREPPADKEVEDVVRAYLRGFERGDDQALASLLTQDATMLGRQGSTREQLVETWKAKFRTFDVQHLAGHELARLSEIERETYESLEESGRARPSTMRPGDIYVRVPIIAPRAYSDQLLGDTLVLLLRREDGRLRIAGQADESGPR
jgi:hypothetical protein